jgi:hypothetical protein
MRRTRDSTLPIRPRTLVASGGPAGSHRGPPATGSARLTTPSASPGSLGEGTVRGAARSDRRGGEQIRGAARVTARFATKGRGSLSPGLAPGSWVSSGRRRAGWGAAQARTHKPPISEAPRPRCRAGHRNVPLANECTTNAGGCQVRAGGAPSRRAGRRAPGGPTRRSRSGRRRDRPVEETGGPETPAATRPPVGPPPPPPPAPAGHRRRDQADGEAPQQVGGPAPPVPGDARQKHQQPGADLQRRRREAPGRQPGGPPRPAGRQGDGGAGQQPEPQRDPAVDRGGEVDDETREQRRHRPRGAPAAGRGDAEAPDRQQGQRAAERPAPRGVDRGREPAPGVDLGEAGRTRRAPWLPRSKRAHHRKGRARRGERGGVRARRRDLPAQPPVDRRRSHRRALRCSLRR